jgi:hypothetical protein
LGDIREAALLEQVNSRGIGFTPRLSLGEKLKFAARRFVVATSATPLKHFYLAVYRWHRAYAVRRLRRFANLRAIYITRGMALGEVQPGISDIDIDVYGDWTDAQQEEITRELFRLKRLSPLFDVQPARTINSLQSMYATDYSFQLSVDQGRTDWKLLYGESIFPLLPAVPETRRMGGYYMELRAWWHAFVKSTFGFGPMATDPLFRNSIPYKVIALAMNFKNLLDGGFPQSSRHKMMEAALERSKGAERDLLSRLIASAKDRYRSFDGDIQEESFQLLMRTYEKVHSRLGDTASFQSAEVRGVYIDAAAAEMMVSPAARAYVQAVIERVQAWPGYRATFLAPSLAFFNPDDLVLMVEVKPDALPTVAQVQELCRLAVQRTAALPQRVALFLLLPQAAYQLQMVSEIELWHHTLSPQANPDLFALLERAEFVADGLPRTSKPRVGWSRFANDLVNEELDIRRAAMGKIAAAGELASLDLLRNLWRHLQLEVVQRSTLHGTTALPMTVPAIHRMLQQSGLPASGVFEQLRDAYAAEICGNPVDIRPLLPELMALLSGLSGA